jgi:hypothetical protein
MSDERVVKLVSGRVTGHSIAERRENGGYSYTATFSVGIGVHAGASVRVLRVWADGQCVPTPERMRVLVENGEYAVEFQDLDIGPHGNRIPNLEFEIVVTPR